MRNITGLRVIISTIQPMKVSTLEKSCVMLCSSISCTLSASFVKRLISSPCVCVSKVLRPSCCILSNRSLRITFKVRWATFMVKRVCAYAAAVPARYIIPKTMSAPASPLKLPGRM